MKEISKKNLSKNEKIWISHIKACDQSGLSRRAYCRRHNLSYDAFHYWKKKLYSLVTFEPQLVEVPVKSNPGGKRDDKDSALKVEFGRFKIEIQDNFCQQRLARLISALEDCQ